MISFDCEGCTLESITAYVFADFGVTRITDCQVMKSLRDFMERGYAAQEKEFPIQSS